MSRSTYESRVAFVNNSNCVRMSCKIKNFGQLIYDVFIQLRYSYYVWCAWSIFAGFDISTEHNVVITVIKSVSAPRQSNNDNT